MPTLSNLVRTPTTAASADPVALLTDLANGFSDAIGGLGTGKRQPRRFHVAFPTQKTSLASLITLQNGDECFTNSTQSWDTYINGVWKLTKTLRPVTWPFAATNISGSTSAGSSFSYDVDGDMVSLRGTLTYANGLTWTGSGLGMALPFPCGTITSGSIPAAYTHVGTVVVRDANNSPYPMWIGAAYIKASATVGGADNSTLLVSMEMGSASGDPAANFGTLYPISRYVPINTGILAGCTISIDIHYRRQ